jgi:flagellar protein FliO/FliZ
MATAATSSALAGSLGTSVGTSGLAAFGKMAFALLVILAIIFLAAWLMRRIGPVANAAGQHLKLIAAKAVGTRERVVIVEVDGTWLVLGVTAGGISKLHELPAGKPTPAPTNPVGGTFAHRFAAALRQNLRGSR